MKSSTVKSFNKKLACPSSNLLLSFSRQRLPPEINLLVKHHLAACDFCYCEMPLLAFYTVPHKSELRIPELPINLRVLAESIFFRSKSGKRNIAGVAGGKGFTLIDVEDSQSCN